MRQREPRLEKLKAAIDAAQAVQRRPLEPGEESRPLYPLHAYVDGAGMREIWRAVGALRQRELPLANRFLGDVSLGEFVTAPDMWSCPVSVDTAALDGEGRL